MKPARQHNATAISDLAADMRARLPAHLQEACTPEGIMWRVFGLSPGESQCPECGVVVELYHYDAIPAFRCVGCERPWPRRCATSGCPTLVQPAKVELYRGQVDWDEPGPYCAACDTEATREHRRKVLVRGRGSNPWGIPRQLRADASTSYKVLDWRKRLDDVARMWLSSDLGRAPGHDPVLYFHSPGPGCGKSTGAARLAILAVTNGKARSLVWAREAELFLVLASRGDQAPREMLLRRLYDCELLIVDEVFKADGSRYTTRDGVLTRVGEQLRDCWHVRFEDGRPTIFTSNHWCGERGNSLWGRLMGEPIESRFFGAATVVECDGPDMRVG